MKLGLLLIMFMTCFMLLSQEEVEYPLSNPKLTFGLFCPMVGYSAQHHSATNFPIESAPLHFEKKFQMADYQILKFRFIFYDKIMAGAGLSFNSQANFRNGLDAIKYNNPELHISNWKNEKFKAFTPYLFVGYRFKILDEYKTCYFIGINAYLNFDNIKYGGYSYDAKFVNYNNFYSFNYKTTSRNNISGSYEIELSRSFRNIYRFRSIVAGIKIGYAHKNQSIDFNSTRTSIFEPTHEESKNVTFKTDHFQLSLFCCLELFK